MNRVVRNIGFNTLSLFVTFVAGIVTSAITARVLGPSLLGTFSFAMWLLLTLVLVFDIGAASATMKFVSELEGGQGREVGNRLTLYLLVFQSCVGFLVAVTIISFAAPLTKLLGNAMTETCLIIVAVGVPIYLTYLVVHGCLSGFQRYDLISIIQIGTAIINLIGTIIILTLGRGIQDLLLMTICIYSIQLIACIVLIWRMYPMLPTTALSMVLKKRVIRYCLGLFVITFFNAVIWQRSETYFLGRYSTVEQVAYYSLAYNLSRILVSMLPEAFTQILMPHFSRSLGIGDRGSIQRAYEVAIKYVAFLVLPLCLFTVALAHPLVALLYGASYYEVAFVLQVMLIASLMYAIIAPSHGLFLALGKPYLAIAWLAPIALLNLVLAYIIAPSYGAMGAAIVKTICQTLAVIASVVYLIRLQGFRYPWLVVSKTLMSAVIGAIVIYLIAQQGATWVTILVGVPVGTIIYLASLLGLGAFDALDHQAARTVLDRFLPLLRRQYE